MRARSTGTRRRSGGPPRPGRPGRHGRHDAEADELAEVARRRLTVALQPAGATARPAPGAGGSTGERDLIGGWVPQPPPGAAGEPPVNGRSGRPWLPAVRDRLPAVAQAVLVAPSARALAGLLLVVAVAVASTGAAAWLARPQEQPVPAPATPATTVGEPLDAATGPGGQPHPADGPAAGEAATAAPSTVVLVHVAGAVRRPGLVELPAGARVADAVDGAGGMARAGDPASVNLARPVVDGEQVVVARRGDAVRPLPAPTPGGAGLPPASGGTTLDLNTATLEQLDGLPGIGPVLAQRILDWRTANGRFSVVDELGEVSGIGEATLADLRPLVTV